MHEPYDDDDNYHDDDYDHDYDYNPYKFYFQFDVGNTPLSDWIEKMINDIVNQPFDMINVPGFPVQKFPVSSWNPDTGKDNTYQCLGSNYQGNTIWKKKYFAIDKINIAYKMHLQSHAKHFVLQPTYYKGLFDILN